MRGHLYFIWLLLWVLGLPMTGRTQYVLIDQEVRGGVTADGYNLRYHNGVHAGTYHLSIPPGTTRIEKAVLCLLFTGDYAHLLPQSFQLNGDVYTFSHADIKTTLFPTPYGTDEKAYIAAVDVNRSIHAGQNIYSFQFVNYNVGASNRLTSTYLTVLYAHPGSKPVQVIQVLNNRKPVAQELQEFKLKLPATLARPRSAMLSVWADYACNMPWTPYPDYLNIYFNSIFLGTLAGGQIISCFGSLGSFGFHNEQILATRPESNPDWRLDSTDALSDISTIFKDSSSVINFGFTAETFNNSHFMNGFILAYRTDSINIRECIGPGQVLVNPVPFGNQLRILKQPTDCPVRLKLYNSIGQLILYRRELMDGENLLPTGHLAAGVYVYHIYTGSQVIRGKVMKL
jgi:hypothetical protein